MIYHKEEADSIKSWRRQFPREVAICLGENIWPLIEITWRMELCHCLVSYIRWGQLQPLSSTERSWGMLNIHVNFSFSRFTAVIKSSALRGSSEHVLNDVSGYEQQAKLSSQSRLHGWAALCGTPFQAFLLVRDIPSLGWQASGFPCWLLLLILLWMS